MRANTITLVSIFAVAMLLCFASQRVEAGEKFKSTLSGTFVTTVFDLDADSCTGTPPICTDLSFVDTFSGKTSGTEEAGPFTGQAILELGPVPGTGCAISPKIKGCTFENVANACVFQNVGVETIVDVYSRTGDILIATVPSGGETLCLDTSTGKHAGTASGSLTGGTGKFADVTGTFTESFHGQSLSSDPQGHSFGWIQAKLTGTIIEP